MVLIMSFRALSKTLWIIVEILVLLLHHVALHLVTLGFMVTHHRWTHMFLLVRVVLIVLLTTPTCHADLLALALLFNGYVNTR